MHTRPTLSVTDSRGITAELGHPGALQGTLKVAVAQTTSNTTHSLELNAAKHAKWIELAAKEGARVVLFPELSMTGYFAQRVAVLAGDKGLAKVANARLRAAEDVIAATTKKNNIYAIIGIPVFFDDITPKNPKPWYNTAWSSAQMARKSIAKQNCILAATKTEQLGRG